MFWPSFTVRLSGMHCGCSQTRSLDPVFISFFTLQNYSSSLLTLLSSCRCWKQPPGGGVHLLSMDTKELLGSVLTILGQVVGAEVAAAPSSWSRAVFWLHNKVEKLDWTVRFHLKPVWGQHFKNEVPLTLLDVCHLPEQV